MAAHEGAPTMMFSMRPSARHLTLLPRSLTNASAHGVAWRRNGVPYARRSAEFPKSGHILELGGGTGEDAAFLAGAGYEVFLTDPSPTMVARAKAKLSPFGRGG